MKVLKKGYENDKLWKTEKSCTGKGWEQEGNRHPCGALLEVSALDIYYRDHNFMGRGSERYYGFICPECNCFTEIDTDRIPDYVKNNSKEYIGIDND